MTTPPLRDLTLDQLREYDGTGPTGKIYLAVRGVIFDVSAGGKDYYGEGWRALLIAAHCFVPLPALSFPCRCWLSCDGWA